MSKINIAYNRKPTEDKSRQIQSIEDQRNANKLTAERNHEKIDQEFCEEKSGKTPYLRPQFSKMMELVYSGQVKYLFCWKIDRLSRNMAEAGMVMQALQTNFIEAIITPDRTFTPQDNVLVIAVEFGIANEDIKKLNQNVKRGLTSKNEKGWRPGKAPLGYTNDKYADKGAKKVLVDEKKFSLLRIIWERALTGKYSYMDLVRYGQSIGLILNESDELAKSTLIRILSNPFYFGEYTFKDKVYKGSHIHMVTREEFDLVQKIYKIKTKPRNSKHENPYNGLIKCGECNFTVTPEPIKIKRIKSTNEIRQYKYWRCTHKSKTIKCSQKSIKEKELENQFNTFLQDLEIDERFIKWSMKHIETYADALIEDRQKLEEVQSKTLKDVQSSLDHLTKLFISPNNSNGKLLTENEFITQKNDLTIQRDKALEELGKLGDSQDKTMENIRNNFNLCLAVIDRFNNGGIDEKKTILINLARTIFLKDGKLYIESKPFFTHLSYLKKGTILNPTWLELTEDNKEKDINAFEKIQTIISG